MKKRILFLTDVDIFSPGGAQESMKIIMDKLGDNYEFNLIGPNGEKLNENHYILENYQNFVLRGKKPYKLLKLLKDIRNIIKHINPDIIHVQMSSTLVIINILIQLRLIKKDIKIVYTDRGVYGKYGKLTTYSINNIVKRSSYIITTTYVNQNNYRLYLDNFSKYEGKFEVIPNTGGMLFDEYDEEMYDLVREKLGIKKKVIGFCGRFSEEKNWPLAQELIDRLNGSTDLCFIVIIGTDGTERNKGEAQKYIDELFSILGKDKLRCYIDVPLNEISNLFYAIDVFVMTSIEESFGRTAVEAMARKSIVFGTPVDGLYEVINNEKFLFNNAEEGSTKILEILDEDEKDIENLKEKFFFRYKKNFGYQKNIQLYKNLYEKI